MHTKIVIIGAGRIGRALEYICYKKHHISVALWDKDPEKIPGQSSLDQIIPHADIIFLCVSSWQARTALESISSLLNKRTLVVALTKGIEKRSKKTINEMIEELLPGIKYALLAGPMLAEEIIKDGSGAAIVASSSGKPFTDLERILGPDILLEYSDDIRGVALSAALKNVYALGLAMTECLGWSGNMRGFLVREVIEEMGKIINHLGGRIETPIGLAGLGDLIATGFSPYSRNHQVGIALVEKKELQTCEGVESLPPLLELLGEEALNLPILSIIAGVALEGKDAKLLFSKILDDKEKLSLRGSLTDDFSEGIRIGNGNLS